MEQKTANELKGLKSHQLDRVALSRVSKPYGDLVLIEGSYAIVGKGYPMGVTTQIVDHMVSSTEWRLTEDHPVLVIKIG